MLNISIGTIDHKLQRYSTCGDYYKIDINQNLLDQKEIDIIRISEMGNPKYEFLVALHEIVEMFLTQERGITEKSISNFDVEFEARNLKGEPGDHPNAPYRKEHKFATKIEKMMAKELGVNWKKYEITLDKLYTK